MGHRPAGRHGTVGASVAIEHGIGTSIDSRLQTDEFDRLYRLIEGLLDADILLAEEAGALLEAIDRAHRCHREGDREAAHRHWLRLGLAIEWLVENGRLEEAHGRAALALVRQMPAREASLEEVPPTSTDGHAV